jgi:hypothetical protein
MKIYVLLFAIIAFAAAAPYDPYGSSSEEYQPNKGTHQQQTGKTTSKCDVLQTDSSSSEEQLGPNDRCKNDINTAHADDASSEEVQVINNKCQQQKCKTASKCGGHAESTHTDSSSSEESKENRKALLQALRRNGNI